MTLTLGEIFAKYGCDKGSAPAEPWMCAMGYEQVYEALLAPLRDKPICMLELGWGEYDPERKDHSNPTKGGRSARAWREYFSQAEIHVVDIYDKVNTVDGVWLHRANQTDAEFMRKLYNTTGGFDLIIDDASHVSSLTIASFKILWPMLKPGGIYVVEDLHSSYHPWYFGPHEANEDPGNTKTRTAMNFFKRLADEAFYRGTWVHGPKRGGSKTEWDCYPMKYWLGYEIESVSFHFPQLIVVRKRA